MSFPSTKPDDQPGATGIATDAEPPEDAGIWSSAETEISCRTIPVIGILLHQLESGTWKDLCVGWQGSFRVI